MTAVNQDTIAEPLTLPCGVTVRNRIMKSAMSEQLGDKVHNPKLGLATVYRTWAEGGLGISVTGNIMVDRTALGEPANVVLDEQSDLASFYLSGITNVTIIGAAIARVV